MGERKVLNKYFPPDFDPKKVPRLKRDPEKQINVRMMIPFSMQCNTCGEFMYRGKKFNSLKEDCIGEDYLGIRRFRFYIKCVICSQEITFKTDPENGDYELETGASRNFESWTDKQATEKEHKEARELEEKSDNMKQLENRTLDSKIELEIMDALDEIKAVNRRHETVDTADVLKASAARREKGLRGVGGKGDGDVDEDDAVIASIQFGGPKVRRLADAYDSSDDDGSAAGVNGPANDSSALQKGKGAKSSGGGSKAKGKKRAASSWSVEEGTPNSQPVRKSGASLSGAGDFGEDPTTAEDDDVGGNATAVDASGSLLVSAIEAQAKREAERVKAAATGSTGTKIVVKQKKRREKGDGGGAVDEGQHKKRKKHKRKERDGDDSKKSGSVGAATPAPASPTAHAAGAGKPELGGLNLLGSYASSSGSEGDGR
eukprot:g10072.t1